MSTGTTVALFAISSLSLLASTATFVVVLVGAKKANEEVVDLKERTNVALRGLKHTLTNLEF